LLSIFAAQQAALAISAEKTYIEFYMCGVPNHAALMR
jgi:hypothetical protein